MHRRHLRPLRLLVLVLAVTAPAAMGDGAREGAIAPASEGARTWERCAVCHGTDGSGRPDGTFPKIAGQHASVISAQLEAIRAGTRPNPVMRPHVEELSDPRDVSDIAAFVAAMPRDATCETGPGDDLERGARLYGEACASCHGEAGQGDAERTVPWIACQHYDYLLRRARQLAAWGRSRHPDTTPPLGRWTDAELRAVMDYAARLPARQIAPVARREPGPARSN